MWSHGWVNPATMMVSGIDGCPGGWIVLTRQSGSEATGAELVTDLQPWICQSKTRDVVAIDIPIGLLESGTRECDRLARARLGVRSSCVFDAPIRTALHALTQAEASRIRRQVEGKGVPAQAFGIYRKVREVDELLRSERALQTVFFEVHPEVCFGSWVGEPILSGKKSREGFDIRLSLVEQYFGEGQFQSVRKEYSKSRVSNDDILDAFAALWTAERIYRETSARLPEVAPLDNHGLRMAIHY